MISDEARKQIIQDYMGKPVHVVVDRPIGYVHRGLTYPINYGYIPGLLAGDGEEQDVYILGVDEPILEFDGQVVAAICRKNDCEDKLVVAPEGSVFHQGQIAEAVYFQEQYFISTIDSLFRKSCGVIPFRRNGEEREYLILLQTNNCWSFPKGHMEAGETEMETALREIREETGLRVFLREGFREAVEYSPKPNVKKQVIYFIGFTLNESTLHPQEEEVSELQWMEIHAAYEAVTFRNDKNLIAKAMDFIDRRGM